MEGGVKDSIFVFVVVNGVLVILVCFLVFGVFRGLLLFVGFLGFSCMMLFKL